MKKFALFALAASAFAEDLPPLPKPDQILLVQERSAREKAAQHREVARAQAESKLEPELVVSEKQAQLENLIYPSERKQ